MGAQLGPVGRGVSPLLQGDSLGPQPESLSSAMTSAPGTLGLFLILRSNALLYARIFGRSLLRVTALGSGRSGACRPGPVFAFRAELWLRWCCFGAAVAKHPQTGRPDSQGVTPSRPWGPEPAVGALAEPRSLRDRKDSFRPLPGVCGDRQPAAVNGSHSDDLNVT